MKLRNIYFIFMLLALSFSTFAQTFAPNPDILSQAMGTALVRWQANANVNTEYTAHNVVSNVKAMNYLALIAYQQPGNAAVRDRLLQHIRSAIAGGNEPTCRGTIAGWADNALAQSLALSKATPAVWDQLTAAEKDKCDWLMRALTVAGNYNQNYHNNANYCILGQFTSAGKRTNPNIQEGYVGIMIAAHIYFGGAANVNAFLAAFDYDTYLAELTSRGFTNIVFGWTYMYGNTPTGRAQMKTLMKQGGTPVGGGSIGATGVRRAFTFADYNGSPLPEIPYDPFRIYEVLAKRMYNGIVKSSSNSGQAYILNNNISPVTGLLGMGHEFQTLDAAGERSAVTYVFDGWMNSLLTYATLKTMGLWGNTPAHVAVDRRFKVGTLDMLYKYKAGYQARYNGNLVNQSEPAPNFLGYGFLKDIWMNYLWESKDLNVLELLAPTATESFDNLTLTDSFSDGTFGGANGLTWEYAQARQNGTEGVKPNDTKSIALSAGSGSLQTTLSQPVKGFRFKVRNVSQAANPSLVIRLNSTPLRTFTNFNSDETMVVMLPNLTALSGNELTIANTGPAELLLDDLELEQVSAPAAPSGLTASNIQMRELTLNWTDNAISETGFKLERRLLPSGDFESLQDSLAPNTTRFVDVGVLAETAYEYRLSAFNLAGLSASTQMITETLPLTAQDSLSFQAVADAHVNAGSNANTNYGANTFMLIKNAGATNNATREAFFKFDLSTVNKPIQRARLRLTTLNVEVNALNPATLRLDAMGESNWAENTINWNNSRAFPLLGEMHRWDVALGNNLVDIQKDILQNQSGGMLTIKASLLDNLLITVASKEDALASRRPLLTLFVDHLAAPSNLTVSGNGQPVLKWQDHSDNESAFTIQRKTQGGSFADVATVMANETTFTDLNAEAGVTYLYRIFAANDRGKSAYSNIVQISTPTLQVLYQNGDAAQPGNNQIKPEIQIKNLSSNAVPYQELTLRYWFTSENHAAINTYIDWAQPGTSSVKTRYVRLTEPRQGADGYVEYRFENGAGHLQAGADSGPVRSRIAKQNWTDFSETDDHSYQNNTEYQLSGNITLYRNDTLVWGTEPAPTVPVTAISAASENRNATTSSNTIHTYLKLTNTGNVPLAYSDLKVRYWFTAEGAQPLNHWIDYAALGAGNIGRQVVKPAPALPGADSYLELGFSNVQGSLEPASSTGNIQLRIAKNDWSVLEESDDHSYKPAGPMGVNEKITVYYKGQLLFGEEPAPANARMSAEKTEHSDSEWFIYPNPANDQITLNGGDRTKAIELTIFGTAGSVLQQQKTYFQHPISVGLLSPGSYVLKIRQGKIVRYLKLVKN